MAKAFVRIETDQTTYYYPLNRPVVIVTPVNALATITVDINGNNIVTITDNNTEESEIIQIQSQIAIINNNLTVITNDISTIDNNINTINNDITTITNDISTITNDISTIDNYLTTVTNDISTINNDITNITSDIATINNDITNISTEILALATATVAMSILGSPLGGQTYQVMFAQPGTLLGAGAVAHVLTLPASTNILEIETLNSGTIVPHGSISITNTGSITISNFTQTMVAGDVLLITNQVDADSIGQDYAFGFVFIKNT